MILDRPERLTINSLILFRYPVTFATSFLLNGYAYSHTTNKYCFTRHLIIRLASVNFLFHLKRSIFFLLICCTPKRRTPDNLTDLSGCQVSHFTDPSFESKGCAPISSAHHNILLTFNGLHTHTKQDFPPTVTDFTNYKYGQCQTGCGR